MNKIKIRREGDQIIVERVYKVVPNRTIHFENRPKVNLSMIKEHIIQAVKARMGHCLNQLDTEILPSQDKIFNEIGIFSPSKGVYFNQESFESMENAIKRLLENSDENMLYGFKLIELNQVTKALISYRGDLPEEEAHYLSGLVMEALMISLKEPRTVLRTEPK